MYKVPRFPPWTLQKRKVFSWLKDSGMVRLPRSEFLEPVCQIVVLGIHLCPAALPPLFEKNDAFMILAAGAHIPHRRIIDIPSQPTLYFADKQNVM
jgi:hypothetical protein